MKRQRIISFKCTLWSTFQSVKRYLEDKYQVYTAQFTGSCMIFRVAY